MAANTGKAPKGLKRRNARASVEASACVQPSEGVAQRAEEACSPAGPALAAGLAALGLRARAGRCEPGPSSGPPQAPSRAAASGSRCGRAP